MLKCSSPSPLVLVNVMYPAPLLSSLASLTGSLILARQYLVGRKLFKLLFMLQLIDMLVGQFLEFYASTWGWGTLLYKIYYLSSPLSAAILALGVIEVWGNRRLVTAFAIYTLIVTGSLAYHLASSTVDAGKLSELGPFVGGMALPMKVRLHSPLLTIPSGLIILVLSGYLYYRRRASPFLLLLLGNLVFMAAGGLLRRGHGEAFLWLEFIATIILAYSYIKMEDEA